MTEPNIKLADYLKYSSQTGFKTLLSYVHILDKSFLDPPATVAYFF